MMWKFGRKILAAIQALTNTVNANHASLTNTIDNLTNALSNLTNAVNTIIVDFRGYDTFGEIIVLGIAALVIFALSEALLRSPAVTRRLAAQPRERESHRKNCW